MSGEFDRVLKAEIDRAEAEIVFELRAHYADWLHDRLEIAGFMTELRQ